MKVKIVVLGAGFGGLELTSILSDSCGDSVDITLVDASDSFVFGFSKFDVIFRKNTLPSVRQYYQNIHKKGIRFLQSEIHSIDPVARRVITDNETLSADILVIALGAQYDYSATQGLSEGENEFYSLEGAEKLRDVLSTFAHGNIVVGVASAPFKCPPAPSEAALLLHDYFVKNGRRTSVDISLVMPFDVPIPPVPEASAAILTAFRERDIRFISDQTITSLDSHRNQLRLSGGTEISCDLLFGVPKHRVPKVVDESGLIENSWIPVNRSTLTTKYPQVFAIGDVTSVGTPKAGVFAEGAAQVVAAEIVSQIKGTPKPSGYNGVASCYMEFGYEQAARLDVDFFSGPNPVGTFHGPSHAMLAEKTKFGTDRIKKWFE